MNPDQNLDQDAVRLAKAIRYSESRDNPDAKGASGEFGLYQWMPDTWNATTKKYNLDAADTSRENQNKAAYMTIKELKDAGNTPDKIAAYWNMGGNALTKGYENNVGVNKLGVKYDTPSYVRNVQAQYEHLKSSEQPLDVSTPSTPGNEQYGTPDAEQPVTPLDKIMEVNKGVVKGAGDSLLGLARVGNEVANQTAGRVVNAVKGNGFKPLTDEQMGDGVEVRDSKMGQKADALLKSSNSYQTAGKVVEGAAEFLIPGAGGKKTISESNRLANVANDALNIVAPKETLGALKAAYQTGRTKVTGFMRGVEMDPMHKTEQAAKAVEDLVRAGKMGVKKTFSENANAVYKAVGDEAESLVAKLKAGDVKYILQPEELKKLLTDAQEKIGENPTMVGDAGESATRIFNKFKSFLPQSGDILAEDILAARKKTDAWVRSLKGSNVFDPKTENALSVGLRVIRQGANDLVAAKADDVAVKESLAKQSALYDALEAIAEKGAKAKEIGTSGMTRFSSNHPVMTAVGKQILNSAFTGLGIGGVTKLLP